MQKKRHKARQKYKPFPTRKFDLTRVFRKTSIDRAQRRGAGRGYHYEFRNIGNLPYYANDMGIRVRTKNRHKRRKKRDSWASVFRV